MTKRNPHLKIGSFYWVMPVLDPDRKEEWEYDNQPARFAGWNASDEELWQCIGYEDATWPIRWIGEEITESNDEISK